jgi:hypothetical protein
MRKNWRDSDMEERRPQLEARPRNLYTNLRGKQGFLLSGKEILRSKEIGFSVNELAHLTFPASAR